MMRHDGMGSGMEWMHWGGALVWLLVVVVLVLAIAALVKYLRSSDRDPP
jgi:membrane protein YdbS with pleckstrin-like domain